MNKLSYALGFNIGNNLKNSGISELNTDDLLRGLCDVLENKSFEMSFEEAANTINDYYTKTESGKNMENKKEGETFLEKNKRRENVISLESGLQYEIIQTGNGPKPKITDKVKCHYTGTLINGKEFDSSVKRGEPAIFGLNQVIPGWTEALQLMSTGSKWKLYLPFELAYGEQRIGDTIQPYSALIFEVELLDIL